MNSNDIKIIIQNFKNIYENNISAKDLYACEYNNPLSIDIFVPIILKNYLELKMVHRNKFVMNNIKFLYPSLKNLKVDLNRLGYIIQHFLYYYLIKNSSEETAVHTDCLNLIDIFNINDPNFTYINDSSKDLILLEKIKDLKILDSKFEIVSTQLIMDPLLNYDTCSPIHLFNEQVEIIIKQLEKFVCLINYINTAGPINLIQKNIDTTNISNTKNFLELCDDALKYKEVLKKKSDIIFKEEKTVKKHKSKKNQIIKIIKILSKLNVFPVFIVVILIFNLLTVGHYLNKGYKKR
jgi:hypothetical protein